MDRRKALPILSENGRKLIAKIVELPQGWQTAANLAALIGVSRRTVLRELPSVERWLLAAGFRFTRSPGKGILLDEEEDARRDIKALLVQGRNASSKEERRACLLATLLSTSEPQKTYALAYDLYVSEHTLSVDLDWAETWLTPHGISLYRRPGVGVWVEGTPEARRRAAGALLRNQLPDVPNGLRDGVLPSSLTKLFDSGTAHTVWEILQQYEQESEFQLTDAGFLSLAIHCLLTVRQLQKGDSEPPVFGHPIESEQPTELARRLEQAFDIQLPPAEVQHLAHYLSVNSALTPQTPITAEELTARSLAVALVKEAERVLGVDLSSAPSLIQDLSVHIQPMLYRIEHGTVVDDSQLEPIQTGFPILWQATRQACTHVQKAFSLPPISDAEAAYLAMHIGAVLEAASQLRVRAAVVCPYGIASSKFLAARIRRELPAVHISVSCSIRELNPEDLRKKGISLVISTVSLPFQYPCVIVAPALTDSDRAHLQAALKNAYALPAVKTPVRDTFSYVRHFGAILRELLNCLTIETIEAPQSREKMIHAASRLFCSNREDQQATEAALLRRESLSDTYVKPLQALLLHCRTTGVSGCRFGYLKAAPPFYDGEDILGALVLLAPETSDDVPLQVARGVSELLIEDPSLMNALREGNREAAFAILERGLVRRARFAPDSGPS